jgi:hypothetical protein
MWLLAFAFAAGWTISTAMAAHLPRLLQGMGALEGQALMAGMLIGPAQVAARIVEASVFKGFHPLLSARLSAALHPAGAALLALGTAAIPAFALLHGAGNGILTIARGTVPLTIYGALNYCYRLGILGAPPGLLKPQPLCVLDYSSSYLVSGRCSFLLRLELRLWAPSAWLRFNRAPRRLQRSVDGHTAE